MIDGVDPNDCGDGDWEGNRPLTVLPEDAEIYDGRVAQVTEFGVFVEFRGIRGVKTEGLLHMSELPSSLSTNWRTELRVGDAIRVGILYDDPIHGRIRLSAKIPAVVPVAAVGVSERTARALEG
ncbi:MAG: 30S ribosomal protein S1 [Candidatus Peregrinibacteria bacterium GW2011_GWC2_39_14]|nr:MAG: 30S ribosomal protein S1 [Candidatus Peregrinibacteria bacterium GW2011_GWC2_39_14]